MKHRLEGARNTGGHPASDKPDHQPWNPRSKGVECAVRLAWLGMGWADAALAEEVVHVLLMQNRQQAADRNRPQQSTVVVDDGHIGLVSFHRQQGCRFGGVVRVDLEWRCAQQ